MIDTQNNEEIKKLEEQKLFEENQSRRAKKMMLWFGIISLSMSFAGLTSAYVVSSERKDWLTDFQIPQAFYISLVAIVLSSITIHFAKRAIQIQNNKKGMLLLLSTFVLGVVFVVLQFIGFSQIIENGYYFTGSESSITTSFIYLVVLMHLAHILVGLICLLVVIVNHSNKKYNNKTLGVELVTTFWHFVDILWIYLFLFFYFVR